MAETAKASETPGEERAFLDQRLDGLESVGNGVPHPAIYFPGPIELGVGDFFIGGVMPTWTPFAQNVV